MIKAPSLQHILISLAIVTSFGVLVHDSKLDQAATVALAIPFGMTLALGHMTELKTEGHTHVERALFERTVRQASGVPPRTDNRKYMLVKHARGFNAPQQHTLLVTPVFA